MHFSRPSSLAFFSVIDRIDRALSPGTPGLAIAEPPQIGAGPEPGRAETGSMRTLKSTITDRRRQGARKFMKDFGKSIPGIVALCVGLNVAGAQGAGGNWSYSQTDIGAGSQRITLGYAELGTTLFSMMCDNTSDLVLVRANVSVNLKPGQLTAVQVLVDGATLQIDGNYRDASNGNPGVYHAFEINKPFFASFPHSQQLKFGIPGQTYINASMDADRQTFTRFIGMCNVLISDYREKIAASNQAQPGTQPQTGMPESRTVDAQWSYDDQATQRPLYIIEPSGDYFFRAYCDAGKTGRLRAMLKYAGTAMPKGNAEVVIAGVPSTMEVGYLSDNTIVDGRQDLSLFQQLYSASSFDIRINGQVTTTVTSIGNQDDVRRYLEWCLPDDQYAAMFGSPSTQTNGDASTATAQTTSDQPKNCVAYDQSGQPYRVVCPVPGSSDSQASTQNPPSQNAQANPPVANDDSFSAGEAIALGALAVGAGIIANEINDQFFTEKGAPAAPGGSGQTRITIASVKAIETTFGFGGDEIFLLGSNGARIPANGAQDIDAGQTWSPNASVTATGGLSFDLREWDSFNASDQIGNFTVAANTAPGRYTATLRGDGAVYEVTYDVAGGQVASGGGQTSAPPVSTPAPQARRWSASGSNSDIFVSDCTDCGEDVGMFFACPAIGQPAIVAVPWLATENGPTGLTLPLEMSVGGQRFVYDATLSQPGLVGHVPQFQMSPNDPALEALMAGNAATIVFDGVQANIGLRGSRSALTTFKAHCGWNNIPVGMQSNQGQSMPSGGGTESGMDGTIGAPPDFVWYASAYQDYEDGNTVGALTYGIPETDAASFTATCYPGRNPNANVSFNTGLRTLQLGDPATLFIQPEGANFQYAGSTFSIGGGSFEGVEAQIALTDPVWQAMMQAQNTFLFGAYGGGEGAAQPVGISSAVSQFLATCRTASGQGQTQQQNQQSVFGNQNQQVQLPAPQQGATIDGSYACSDGSSIEVAASTLGKTEIVNMVRNGTDAYALTRQPAQAVGVSYAGGGLTLTAGAGVIQLAGNGASLFCQKR